MRDLQKHVCLTWPSFLKKCLFVGLLQPFLCYKFGRWRDFLTPQGVSVEGDFSKAIHGISAAGRQEAQGPQCVRPKDIVNYTVMEMSASDSVKMGILFVGKPWIYMIWSKKTGSWLRWVSFLELYVGLKHVWKWCWIISFEDFFGKTMELIILLRIVLVAKNGGKLCRDCSRIHTMKVFLHELCEFGKSQFLWFLLNCTSPLVCPKFQQHFAFVSA